MRHTPHDTVSTQAHWSGQTVLIAGAGSGMGAALAHALAQRGARLVLMGRRLEKLHATADPLGAAVVGTHALDIADGQALRAAVANYPTFDHLVSTVADLSFKPWQEQSDDDIERVMRGKFWGAVQLGRLLPTHVKTEGSLLLFTGVAAYRPAVGLGMVAAPNLMLQSVAETLALEHRPRRVNAISPGVVDSGTWSHLSTNDRQALFDSVASGLPVGRVGQVQDLVHAAIAVLENQFINGTVVHVDGGARLV